MDVNQALGLSGTSQPPRPPVSHQTSSFTSTGQQQLDPKAVWLFFLRSLSVFSFIFIWFGIAFITTLVESVPGALGIGLIIFIGVIAIAFIWAKLTYHYYRYELTEEGFSKELGVIFKKYVTIPYDRIQNVDIYRGILARVLGLSDLNIQTAGMSSSFGRAGASAEGVLPALSREIAQEVRDELIRRARKTNNQGL